MLESLPPAERDVVWPAIDPGIHAEVFAEAEDAVRAARLAVLDPESLATIAQDVDPDDAADLLQDLPEDVIEEVLTALDDQERSRLESVLRYAEDTAGGLMNLDVVTIRPDVSLEVVSRELSVGLINAAMWAAVVGLVAGLWFESPGLALVAGAALAINLVCAALSGAGIPMLLKRLNIDPALAGGVILTTVTDVVGFLALLGLGAWFLVA